MYQSTFLEYLKAELPKNTSIIDAVASALDISYDAAHRRVSLKSKFSLEESISLAKYYNLSLDKLFDINDINSVLIEKTHHIENEKELETYFNHSYESLQPLLQQKDSSITYSAKDIPLFYNLNGDLLSRFKYFVWLKLLDKSFKTKNFEDFKPSLSLIEAGKKLGSLYSNLNTKEVWDITTVNSTLKQIHFYYSAGLTNTDTTLELCRLLENLIKNVLERLILKPDTFKLYYNELHLMNNHVLVNTPVQNVLYVPFTILSYYKTEDKATCIEAELFINKQLENSKLLNTSGEKERHAFFNKLISKIAALKQLVKANDALDFQ